ncbi:hypothetical protein K491DRAFT_781729 [Lophiostoma macrostomum CBS 122681]|uniref:SAP domain-containing protein n=1 Tax=Lophiostoma macrostomum CBS 122681 TaxID=1314788 RepID=A0A6A6SZA2_9PLEO|nr:hypothetical protein K491DRAFT_781729 [Lophiostoma macrostomum CBS 122681]
MADYNKQTVANLRQLLKERGIPSTGLTRKAQIIEKLEEQDSAENGAPTEDQADATEQDDKPTDAQETEDGPTLSAEDAAQTEAPQSESAREPTPQDEAGEAAPTTAIADEEPKAPSAQSEAVSPEPAKEVVALTTTQELSPPTISEPPAEPVASLPVADSETQVSDFGKPGKSSSPSNEKPSVEKAELLPIPEHSSSTSVEVSRLNTEELEADSKKRKRRSASPEVPSQDIRAKKSRPSGDAAPEVILKEDKDVVMEQARPEEEVLEKSEEQSSVHVNKQETNGVGGSKADNMDTDSNAKGPAAASGSGVSPAEDAPPATTQRPQSGRKDKDKDTRYKSLFQSSAAPSSTEQISDDRPIAAALHPATPAVYVRNFKRPLKPDDLRKHLITIATPPSATADAEVVKALFLDAMKTHALVLFTSTAAASRVRASLHDRVWPEGETNRDKLWVDFVPGDKVEGWIAEEEDAIEAEKRARGYGRPIPAKRFEVVFPETADGGVEAVFQEVGSNAPRNAPRGPRGEMLRRESEQYAGARPVSAKEEHPAANSNQDKSTKRDPTSQPFQTLDTLFRSTTCKDKLYYIPVSDRIADARLEELRAETSRDWRPEDRVKGRGRGRLDQKMRFAFDERDRLVEVGPDFGPWVEEGGAAGGGGYRGDRGGGGGHRGRGGWRGRGGGGGGWRG